MKIEIKISGKPGEGKTTVLNSLLTFIMLWNPFWKVRIETNHDKHKSVIYLERNA